MQTISNLFHVVVQMINHLTLQITLTDLRSRHKCHSSDLILKNNHGNPNSGELYYSHRNGQPNCDDTIFRGSHIEKWTPTQVLFCFSVNFAKYLRITCLQNTSARLPLYFIEGRKTCFSLQAGKNKEDMILLCSYWKCLYKIWFWNFLAQRKSSVKLVKKHIETFYH